MSRHLFGRKARAEPSQDDGAEPPSAHTSELSVSRNTVSESVWQPAKNQPVELGIINYVNLTSDGRHGNYAETLQAAASAGKPIFANFVEWSGCQGCKDAGARIFGNPDIARAAERYFVPAAFNTWDRSNPKWNQAFRAWSGGLMQS